MWFKAEPHVSVAPNHEILDVFLLGVLFHGSGDGLQHLVMCVWSRSLWVECNRNDARTDLLEKL